MLQKDIIIGIDTDISLGFGLMKSTCTTSISWDTEVSYHNRGHCYAVDSCISLQTLN